jgi:hypothetical protein
MDLFQVEVSQPGRYGRSAKTRAMLARQRRLSQVKMPRRRCGWQPYQQPLPPSAGAEQGQQTTAPIERHQIIATTDVGLAYEYLRHGTLAGDLHHLDALPMVAVEINPDLFDFSDATFPKQLFGADAVRANGGGVHLDGLHGIGFHGKGQTVGKELGPRPNCQDLSTGRLADFQAPMPPLSDCTSA